MAEERSTWWQLHRLQFVHWGVLVLSIFGSFRARLVYILIGLVAVLWLVVAQIVVVLQAEVTLPPGVTPQNPKIEHALLEKIEASRLERSNHTVPAYDAYDRFFAASNAPL
ncbi:MAG: hypothetical protein WD200_00070 [Candidatus Andersenbacteria bacterium]